MEMSLITCRLRKRLPHRMPSSRPWVCLQPQTDHPVLQPFFIGVVGRTLYADLKRMETLVGNSNLDWTIVRSSGLFWTPAVTDYQAAERSINGSAKAQLLKGRPPQGHRRCNGPARASDGGVRSLV